MKENSILFLLSILNLTLAEVVANEGVNSVSLALEIPPSDVVNLDQFGNELKSEVYTPVKRYQCILPNISNSEILLYGAKSWTFPEQVVNLTLVYPLQGDNNVQDQFEDYRITGFRVILYTNGVSTRAFIYQGGLLQKTIGINFICTGVSRLTYKLWLYGVPAIDPNTRIICGK